MTPSVRRPHLAPAAVAGPARSPDVDPSRRRPARYVDGRPARLARTQPRVMGSSRSVPRGEVVVVPSVVPSAGPRVARRAGALAALVLLLTALGASPAAAHNTLRSSDPADGATVTTAPPQVTLTFDQEALDLGTQVVVTGPDGVVVSDGPAQLVDTSVVQPLAATLPAGGYTVEWRVTSADGHPLSGALAFTATEAVGVAAPSPEAPADQPADDPAATESADDASSEPLEPSATADAPVADGADLGGAADDVVTTAGPALSQEGAPAWMWIVVAGGAIAAVAVVIGAMVASQRRAAEADRAVADRSGADASGGAGPERSTGDVGPDQASGDGGSASAD